MQMSQEAGEPASTSVVKQRVSGTGATDTAVTEPAGLGYGLYLQSKTASHIWGTMGEVYEGF